MLNVDDEELKLFGCLINCDLSPSPRLYTFSKVKISSLFRCSASFSRAYALIDCGVRLKIQQKLSLDTQQRIMKCELRSYTRG